MAVALAACGEVKGTNNNPDAGSNVDPNADFTLTVDPTSLTIPIAGSAKVTVTVARTGGNTGDIALSATGLGANLTADFSPAAIPDGSTSAEVTIAVKGGTPAGSSTVTITGTAGDKTHSADVAVTSTTITVTGTVRGNRSGVKVGIIGKQSVTSGAGGVFTFTDVTPPYDLYTFAPQGCGNSSTPTVYYFDDLTRPDPIVTAATYSQSCGTFTACLFPGPSSNVSGAKSGTGNNTDPVVFAWSEGGFGSGVLNTNGTFGGVASWCSGNTSAGALHALQLTRKPNGAPNTFLGYARTPATYTSGQAATTNLTFTAVASTGTITGTLNGPAGYPTPTVYLVQQFGNTWGSLWTTDTTAIDATFPIIANAGGTALFAQTTLAGANSFYVQPLTATATVDFTMPLPPALTMPIDAATGVTTQTSFAWTASAGAVSQVNLFGGTAARFHIFTTKQQTTIPVIPELPLPSGTAFSWGINAYAPATSANDAAAANELESVSMTDYSGPAHGYATSLGRSFTTQ